MNRYFNLLFCIPKSIWFNLKYFPLITAIKLPILVRRTILKETQGRIVIEGKIKTGLIRIGFGDVAIFDRNRSRGIWQVSGTVTFKGITRLDHGTSISVGRNGILNFGHNFSTTANSSIICKKQIDFGNNCLLSWDILIMDTDFHKILDNHEEIINPDKRIQIGNKVWIGCRSIILKGTVIADDSVIAAGSLISSSFYESGLIIGGNPGRIIKTGIHWNY